MLDKLDLDVGEAIDILDREVFAVIHELPLADVIGEMLDRLDPQIWETADILQIYR